MLVISRKRGESVKIGEAIVTVKHVGRSYVKLMIDAPDEVRVIRTETEDRIAGQLAKTSIETQERNK